MAQEAVERVNPEPADRPEQTSGLTALRSLLGRGPSRSSARWAVLLDGDRLKKINQAYGWSARDGVPRRVSTALDHARKPGEQAAFWAGDQYLVLLPGAAVVRP